MLLSKKQMTHYLGVSISTLDRMVKRHELTPVFGEKTSFGRPSVWFEVPDPEPVSNLLTRPEASPSNVEGHTESGTLEEVPPTSNVDRQLLADLEFAERFKAGEVTDSFGNTITKSSPHKTFLGPEPPVERKQRDRLGVAHMPAALLPDLGAVPASDLSHPMNAGFKGIEAPKRPRHPNQTRQELLNAIWLDIRRGYSR